MLGTGNKVTVFKLLSPARRCDQPSAEGAWIQELKAYKALRRLPGAHRYSRVPAGAVHCPHSHTGRGQCCIPTLQRQKLRLRGALGCHHRIQSQDSLRVNE